MSKPSLSGPSAPPFLDLVADALRTRGYVSALRQTYVEGPRRFILFHNKRHPMDMGAAPCSGKADTRTRSAWRGSACHWLAAPAERIKQLLTGG